MSKTTMSLSTPLVQIERPTMRMIDLLEKTDTEGTTPLLQRRLERDNELLLKVVTVAKAMCPKERSLFWQTLQEALDDWDKREDT